MATSKKKPTARKTKAKNSRTAKSTKTKTASAAADKKPFSFLNASSADKTITLEKLKNFHIFSAISNAIFAVLSVLFMSNTTINMVLAHGTKDELSDGGNSIVGPAYKILCEFEVRYLLAFIFGLSAVFSLLLATRLRTRYEAQVKNSISVLRWIFMGITLGLVLNLVSILSFVQDTATLKLIAGLIITTTILAVIAEQQNKATKGKFTAFYLSLFTGALAWLPLLFSLVGTTVFGIVWFDWYVYVLAAALLVGFSLIATNQFRFIKKGASAKEYLQLEARFINIDFTIKLATFFILLTALYK